MKKVAIALCLLLTSALPAGAQTFLANSGMFLPVNGTTTTKAPALLATTTNITLSGEQIVDGVLTSASRVLVKDQTTASQNGVYVTSSTAWARATDFNTTGQVTQGTQVYVTQGTVNGLGVYSVATADPITIGSTSITFYMLVNGRQTKTLIPQQFNSSAGTGGDDYAALQAMMTASSALGLAWYIPPGPTGKYNTSAMLVALPPTGANGQGVPPPSWRIDPGATIKATAAMTAVISYGQDGSSYAGYLRSASFGGGVLDANNLASSCAIIPAGFIIYYDSPVCKNVLHHGISVGVSGAATGAVAGAFISKGSFTRDNNYIIVSGINTSTNTVITATPHGMTNTTPPPVISFFANIGGSPSLGNIPQTYYAINVTGANTFTLTNTTTSGWTGFSGLSINQTLPSMSVPYVISAMTNFNPGAFTTTLPHGLNVGDPVFVADLGGVTNALGQYKINTVPTSTSFTLKGYVSGTPLDTTSFGTYTGSPAPGSVRYLDPTKLEDAVYCANCNDLQTSDLNGGGVRIGVNSATSGGGYDQRHTNNHFANQLENGDIFACANVHGKNLIVGGSCDAPLQYGWRFDDVGNQVIGAEMQYGTVGSYDKFASPLRVETGGGVFESHNIWTSSSSSYRLIGDLSGDGTLFNGALQYYNNVIAPGVFFRANGGIGTLAGQPYYLGTHLFANYSGSTSLQLFDSNGGVAFQIDPTTMYFQSTNNSFANGANFGSAGSVAGYLGVANGSGGGALVTIKNQGATGAYNFNLPATAGSSGNLLKSGGGGTTSMTWAVSGTDYAPATSGSALQLANGSGGFSSYAGTTAGAGNVLTALTAAGASTSPLAYTNANTASTLVARDGSGNFSAGTISAALNGNVTGNVSGTAATVTGATQASITSAANLATVGTLTTGSINWGGSIATTSNINANASGAGLGVAINVTSSNTAGYSQLQFVNTAAAQVGGVFQTGYSGNPAELDVYTAGAYTGNVFKFTGTTFSLSTTVIPNSATTSALCYNTGTGALSYNSTIGTCTVSDGNLKNVEGSLSGALDKILKIHGVYYGWKDRATYGTGRQVGVIAQDVQKVYPELVSTDSTGRLSADYQKLVAPIIEALRELKADNDNIRACSDNWKCRIFGWKVAR